MKLKINLNNNKSYSRARVNRASELELVQPLEF